MAAKRVTTSGDTDATEVEVVVVVDDAADDDVVGVATFKSIVLLESRNTNI